MPVQDTDDDDIIYVSKSEMKRDMLALQTLGEALIRLDRKQMQTLQLPEQLMNALLEAKRLTAHGAISRQKQYIGKLMRHVDPEPIQAYLDTISGVSDLYNAWFHRLERLRDNLLADGKALATFISEHPDVEVQYLRQLIRNAQKEQAESKPPKAFRELFQYLKKIVPAPEIPGLPKQSVNSDDE